MSVCHCGSPLSVTRGGTVFCRDCLARRRLARGKCRNGHDLKPETIRIHAGNQLRTVCRLCNSARHRRYRRRNPQTRRTPRPLRRDQLDEMVVERIVRGGFEQLRAKPTRREWSAVFASVGDRIPVGELARRAGVSDRTVYRMQKLHRAAQAA